MIENSFGILVKGFRALLTTMEQRPKVVRDNVLRCVVLHNMLRSHRGEQTDNPLQLTTYNHHRQTWGNRDIERGWGNFRNPSREAKHQRDLLKDYFNHMGVLAGQEDTV